MKRFGSQLIVDYDSMVCRNTIVEINETEITDLINLKTSTYESSHTVFIDGIISGEIVSLKKRNINPQIFVKQGFQYVTIEQINNTFTNSFHNNIIFDLGTEDAEEATQLLRSNFFGLNTQNIIDLITSCSTKPAKLLGLQNQVRIGDKTQLHIWQNIDLVNKLLTKNISIRKL